MPPTRLQRKYFARWMVYGYTYLGGPMAAVYMLSQNEKVLGHSVKAARVRNTGLVLTVTMIIGMVLIPERTMEKIPRLLIPIVYSLVAREYFVRNQKSAFDESFPKHKWYTGLLVALLGLVLFLGTFLVVQIIFLSWTGVF